MVTLRNVSPETAAIEAVVELLWRQWAALGVAVTGFPERRWLVDPEALIVASQLMKKEEPRLGDLVRIWGASRASLISRPRMKRMRKAFLRTIRALDLASVFPEVPAWPLTHRDEARAKKILAPLDWSNPALLWLKLRVLLGSSARTGVVLYFLRHPTGSSLVIARTLELDQKSVYAVLQAWEMAGLVHRQGKKRGYSVQAGFSETWLRLLGYVRPPAMIWFGKVLPALMAVVGLIRKYEGEENDYLLSSRLRDLLPSFQELWDVTEMPPPEPRAHPGARFAGVFFSHLNEALAALLQKSSRQGEEEDPRRAGVRARAHQVLRRRFPAKEGWAIFEAPDPDRPDFMLERRDPWGVWRRVVATVVTDCEIREAHVERLRRYARKLEERRARVENRILIVPAGADTSRVPEDIQVVFLRGERCGKGGR